MARKKSFYASECRSGVIYTIRSYNERIAVEFEIACPGTREGYETLLRRLLEHGGGRIALYVDGAYLVYFPSLETALFFGSWSSMTIDKSRLRLLEMIVDRSKYGAINMDVVYHDCVDVGCIDNYDEFIRSVAYTLLALASGDGRLARVIARCAGLEQLPSYEQYEDRVVSYVQSILEDIDINIDAILRRLFYRDVCGELIAYALMSNAHDLLASSAFSEPEAHLFTEMRMETEELIEFLEKLIPAYLDASHKLEFLLPLGTLTVEPSRGALSLKWQAGIAPYNMSGSIPSLLGVARLLDSLVASGCRYTDKTL